MKKISERLKEYRLNHNLTQYEMSKQLHVSVSTYNWLENGKSVINTKTTAKIAQLLDIDISKVRKLL